MRKQILSIFLLAVGLCELELAAFPQDPVRNDREAAFTFAEIKYIHRFTQKDQQEYTPSGQEDLNAWQDMVTINYYRKAIDGDTLAATANAVLERYKAAQAMIVKTDSLPKTKDKPAEHLIVAIFGQPEFIEVSFARFRMHNGIGIAVIYGHRIYGRKVGNVMSEWLQKNGPYIEAALMKWDAMPKPITSK